MQRSVYPSKCPIAHGKVLSVFQLHLWCFVDFQAVVEALLALTAVLVPISVLDLL